MFRPAKHHDITLRDGINMRVLEWEAPEGAPTFVCVHGLLRRAEDFIDFATQNPGWRVIAPDVRGRGGSDWAPVKTYNIPQYVEDMHDLLGYFELKQTAWVGTSMGGLIGMRLAATAPGIITKMVLNDVGPHVPAKAMRRIYSYGKVYPRFKSFEQAKSLYGKVYAPFNLTDEQLNNLTQNTIREEEDGTYAPHYDPGIGHAMKGYPLFPFTMWRQFRKIQSPMLVIRGETSDVLLKHTVKGMQRLGKAPVYTYEEPQVGHAPLLTKPHTLEAIRRFMAQV